MARVRLDRTALAKSPLSPLIALKEGKWMEPESKQTTYLNDFRRHNIHVVHEKDETRIRDDDALETEFKASLVSDGFADSEIARLKRYYTQTLLSLNMQTMVDSLLNQGIMPAQGANEVQNRRILIRKKIINGQPVVVAEAEYWNIQCYALSVSGSFDETKTVLIPGKLTSVFILEEHGFALLHIDASNSYLSRMMQGEIIDESMDAIVRGAVEEEHTSAVQELTVLEENLNIQDPILACYLGEVKTEIAVKKSAIDPFAADYTHQVNRLNRTANRVTAAVEMPYHAPTLNQLHQEANEQVPSKLKWALVGVCSVLVVGVCLTAAVMSFGILSVPSVIVGAAAVSTAVEAASVVFGTAGLVSASAAAYQGHKPNKLMSLCKRLSLFPGLPQSNRSQTLTESRALSQDSGEDRVTNPKSAHLLVK